MSSPCMAESTKMDALGNVARTVTLGPNGLLSSHVTGQPSVFYTFDDLGQPAQRLGPGQNVLTSHGFDAYGSNFISLSPPNDPYGYYGAQYGYYTDLETGLQLLTNPYCDASNGRFLTRDPIGTAGGQNLYEYTSDNTVGGIDPSGYRPLTGRDIRRMHSLYTRRGDVPLARVNSAVRDLKAAIGAVPNGQPDSPGLRALWWAIDRLGGTDYAQGANGNDWNCNVFVYDAFLNGADVPMPDRHPHWFGTSPYGANELGNPNKWFRYFNQVSNPLPGDMAAFVASVGSGHTTIVVGSGVLIYAGSAEIKLGTYSEVLGSHVAHAFRRHQ